MSSVSLSLLRRGIVTLALRINKASIIKETSAKVNGLDFTNKIPSIFL
jgi:hypothetical protein